MEALDDSDWRYSGEQGRGADALADLGRHGVGRIAEQGALVVESEIAQTWRAGARPTSSSSWLLRARRIVVPRGAVSDPSCSGRDRRTVPDRAAAAGRDTDEGGGRPVRPPYGRYCPTPMPVRSSGSAQRSLVAPLAPLKA